MRDDFATCPRCDIALDPDGTRHACSRCRGRLVPERELYDLVSNAQIQAVLAGKVARAPMRRGVGYTILGAREAAHFDRQLPLEPIATGERVRCPRCLAQMALFSLYRFAVDRCPAHGIWLDGDVDLAEIAWAAEERIGSPVG